MTIDLLTQLGFSINAKKSQFLPSKCLTHLGFVWNSDSMCVSLPMSKIEKIIQFARSFTSSQTSLRTLASFLGLVVSSSFAFLYAPLHYRGIQFCLIRSLKTCCNWNDLLSIDDSARLDIEWWSNFDTSRSIPVPLNKVEPAFTIYTDASMKGWGAALCSGDSISGSWSSEMSANHINWLELYAIFFIFGAFFTFD